MKLRWRDRDRERSRRQRGPVWSIQIGPQLQYHYPELRTPAELHAETFAWIGAAGLRIDVKSRFSAFPKMGTTMGRRLLLPIDYYERGPMERARLDVHEAEHVAQRAELGDFAFNALWAGSIRGRAQLELAAYRASVRAMVVMGCSATQIGIYIDAISKSVPSTYMLGAIANITDVMSSALYEVA